MSIKTIVILVDHKVRDLPPSALIAFELELLGFKVELQPIDAYKAVYAAFKPSMVIFNHLLASHLAAYSRDLHERGVKVGVLLNEGLLYLDDDRDFNAQGAHPDAHVDLFFSWNEKYKLSLLKNRKGKAGRVVVVGNPRMDFYFSPWKMLWTNREQKNNKKRILVATNFGLAKFTERPREEADKHFSMWAEKVPLLKDYYSICETHALSRQMLLPYIEEILSSNLYDVVLRIHPRESKEFYRKWIATLHKSQLKNLIFDAESPISMLINDCDLEISMDRCSTALESWIAGKPTIEIECPSHPYLTDWDIRALNVGCSDPKNINGLISEQLKTGAQKMFLDKRNEHLSIWLNSPNGRTCSSIASEIAVELEDMTSDSLNGYGLKFGELKKGSKLKIWNYFNLSYIWKPSSYFKSFFKRYHNDKSVMDLKKGIKPTDVDEMMSAIRNFASSNSGLKKG